MVFSYFGSIVFVYASLSVALSLSPEEAAVDELNAAFNGFDVNNDDSPLGVTLRWQWDDFKFWCGEGCEGHGADCRTSASLYNHMFQCNGDYVHPVWVASSAWGGIAFKPTAVQNMLARCAYLIDGQTIGRVNHGCGCLKGKEPACKNTDPSTCKPYNGSSPDVASCHCPMEPKDPTTLYSCYYKGPAFNDGQKNNDLHRFVSDRVRQENYTEWGDYTEVVLDSAIINEHLKKDMSNVISAIFITGGHSRTTSTCDAHLKRIT
jgi:hypothetical protein